jgi:hypothetical protein
MIRNADNLRQSKDIVCDIILKGKGFPYAEKQIEGGQTMKKKARVWRDYRVTCNTLEERTMRKKKDVTESVWEAFAIMEGQGASRTWEEISGNKRELLMHKKPGQEIVPVEIREKK